MGQKTGADRRESESMSGDRDPVLLGGWVLPRLDFPTFRITLIAKVMDRLTLRRLSGLGDLTYAEWRVLSRLATAQDGATVGEIADMAWVDRAEVSRAATSLEKRGLTARRENPADRRKPILFPTDAGWARYGPLANDRAAFHEELIADLNDEERRQLDYLLAKIARRLVKSLKGEAVDKN